MPRSRPKQPRVLREELELFAAYALDLARELPPLERYDLPERVPWRIRTPVTHDLARRRAERELARLTRMTTAEADARIAEKRSAWERQKVQLVQICRARISHLTRMQAMAGDWEPPTPEHVPLKALLLARVEEDIQEERELAADFSQPPSTPKGGAKFLREERAELKRTIACHRSEHCKEVALTRETNRWLSQLRRSLGIKTATTSKR